MRDAHGTALLWIDRLARRDGMIANYDRATVYGPDAGECFQQFTLTIAGNTGNAKPRKGTEPTCRTPPL